MDYKELKQMGSKEINRLSESLDKVRSFYGFIDPMEKWLDEADIYGLPSEKYIKKGRGVDLTDFGIDKGKDGMILGAFLEVGIFRNPLAGLIYGLIPKREEKEDFVMPEIPEQPTGPYPYRPSRPYRYLPYTPYGNEYAPYHPYAYERSAYKPSYNPIEYKEIIVNEMPDINKFEKTISDLKEFLGGKNANT